MALVIFISLAIALRKVALGRYIYAVGSDEEAARLAGIRPRLVTFGAFVAMGALVGLAAMMNVRLTRSAVTPAKGMTSSIETLRMAFMPPSTPPEPVRS